MHSLKNRWNQLFPSPQLGEKTERNSKKDDAIGTAKSSELSREKHHIRGYFLHKKKSTIEAIHRSEKREKTSEIPASGPSIFFIYQLYKSPIRASHSPLPHQHLNHKKTLENFKNKTAQPDFPSQISPKNSPGRAVFLFY